MALINTIRKNSGVAVALVAVGLIFFLIGGDIFHWRNFVSNRYRTEVGEIAGQKISLQAYQTVLESLRHSLSTDLPASFVNDLAWKQLVSQVTLQKECTALGLEVSEDELIDLVQGEHIQPEIQAIFQNPDTNQFDKQYLIHSLQQLSNMPAEQQAAWRYFEKQIAARRNQEKLTQLMRQANFITELEIQAQHAAAKHTRSIQLLYVPYYSYSDDEVSINDTMLQQYLKKHSKSYQVEESRAIQYVIFPIQPTAEDQALFLEELQILKKNFAQSRDALTFAKLNTDDQPAHALLRVTALQLPEALSLQKTKLKKSQTIGPVQEGSVYKLYKIDKLPTPSSHYYEIAVIEKRIAPSEQARELVFRKAQQCVSSVQNAVQFDAYAQQQGLIAHSTSIYVSDTQVGTLPQARELVRWLYNDAKIGQVSPVFELGNNYVVAIMTQGVPRGTAPLEQVRDEITFKVKNEHKANQIVARIQQTSGATLKEKAAQYGKEARLITVNSLRFDHDALDEAGIAHRAVGIAFALRPGDQAITIGDNGVLVLELIASNESEPLGDNAIIALRKDRNQLTNFLQPPAIFQCLEELAQVKDNRHRFY